MRLIHLFALAPLAFTLTACGDDEKTTVIERQPIIVQQPAAQPVVVHDAD